MHQMKRITSAFLFFFTAMALVAQVPQKMTYQSVVRDANDLLVTNSTVGVQISITEQSSTFPVYVEQHTVTTNNNGLLTLQVGDGAVALGDFTSIDWGNGVYSIETEVDINGGTNYTINGMSELLSVPYAFHAQTVESSDNGGVTLDEAYNQGGAGAGRIINTDNGAVEIINSVAGNTKGLMITSSVPNSFGVDVAHSDVGVSVRAKSTNPANTFAAIQGETNSASGENAAIVGENTGAGYAVAGQIPASATGSAAIYGSNLRTDDGSGVEAIGYNGVYSVATNALGTGVAGINLNAGSVEASAIGVLGMGYVGVYGESTNAAEGWAGLFVGDVGVEGAGYATGGWINASDRRLKTNIVPITGALDKVNALNGTHYTITAKTSNREGEVKEVQREQYGVIAQEVEGVFPEMVQEKALFSNAGDDTVYKAVEYDQMIPVLLEAIKELNQKVDALQNEVDELKSK